MSDAPGPTRPWGAMRSEPTVNEVRALEDMDPFTDPIFDQPGVPPWQQPTLFPEGGAA